MKRFSHFTYSAAARSSMGHRFTAHFKDEGIEQSVQVFFGRTDEKPDKSDLYHDFPIENAEAVRSGFNVSLSVLAMRAAFSLSFGRGSYVFQVLLPWAGVLITLMILNSWVSHLSVMSGH